VAYEFKLPDIGEGLQEAEIIRWLVSKSDQIERDQPIVEVQTDKATVEISTPVAGTVHTLAGDEGGVVKVGEPLITIIQESETLANTPSPPQENIAATTRKESVIAIPQTGKPSKDRLPQPKQKRIVAAPTVRKKARDLNIPIKEVTGTGKAGRVTEEDLYRYLKEKQEPPLIKQEYRSHPEKIRTERIKIRGLRKVIAEKMTRSAYTAPHVTGMDEIDVSNLIQLRKNIITQLDKDAKITYLPFIMKAIVKALKENPYFNSSIDEQNNEIVLTKQYNIGIATATKEGVVVPVIKEVDQKSILEIAEEIANLIEKARQNKLSMEDISGGTFTITSTGADGGWYATPIINYPEVAIFGAHSIKKKPVVVDDEIVIRSVMGISITFDHRVIDGEPAGRFMRIVKDTLEHPELLLLDLR
jgi:pyruvate dehydrogenase E2 component (dihydrolipoamide acetyltransferase)